MIQVLARHCHTVIDHTVQRMPVQALHGVRLQVLGNGFKNVIGGISSRNQSIDGIRIDSKIATAQLPTDKISRITEHRADIIIGHLPKISLFRHKLTSGLVCLNFFPL